MEPAPLPVMEESLGASTTSPPPTVLVVDDERGPRLALQLILQGPFRVLTADSGEEALEILQQDDIDTVTLDLKMPGLGGQNTLSLIRDVDPELPVVIITGYGSYESAIRAMRCRAFDYISKPFDSRRTLGVVANAVEEHRRRKTGESMLVRPLGAALETLAQLEMELLPRLSKPERAAFESIRENIRLARRHLAGKPPDDDSFELFPPRKEHA
jgi:DNA-binding NtrC family response regulator